MFSCNRKKGVATVEVAFCAPVLIIVTLGIIELTNLIFMRQTLLIAAYDAMRVAVKQGATKSEAIASAQKILDERNIKAYFVFPRNGLERLPRGSYMKVRVRADTRQNAMFNVITAWGNSGWKDYYYEVQVEGLKE